MPVNMTFSGQNINYYAALGNMIDISAQPYGAVGDDSDADDEKIQAALTAASNVNAPKTLYFPQGTWKLGTSLVCSGVHVVAAYGAVFKPGNAAMNMFDLRRNSSLRGGFINCSAITNFTGVGILVDGQYIKGGFSAFNYRSPRIFDVDMISYASNTGQGTGLLITSSGSGNQVTMGVVSGLRIRNFATSIKLNAASSGYVNGWFFRDVFCYSFVNGIHLVNTGAGMAGNKFAGCGFQPTDDLGGGVGVISQCSVLIDGASNNIFKPMDFMDSSVCNDAPVKILPGSSGNIIIGTGIEAAYQIKDYGSYNIVSSRGVIPQRPENFGVLWQPGTAGALANGEQSIKSLTANNAYPGDGFIAAPPEDIQDCLYCAYPSGTYEAKIMVVNRSGATANFTENYWKVKRLPARTATISATVNPGAINAGAFATVAISMYGAVVGDLVIPGPGVDLGGLYMTATITATSVLTLVLHNFTGDTITIASSTWNFWIFPKLTSNHLVGKNPSSLDIGQGETLTFAFNAARSFLFGDYFQGTLEVDTEDFCVSTALGSANNVEMRLENESGNNGKDLGAAVQARIWVWKHEDSIK